MTARLIGTFRPGSQEWHDARAEGVGGSEVGAILGLSPWESRFSLWHRKRGLIGPVEETPEMEWGTRLEPVILAKYRDEHPDWSHVADVTTQGTFVDSDRPWQVANPDLWGGDRVVDAKFSMFGYGWGEPGTDEVPPHVRCQIVWYMDVLGVEVGYLAVLVGGCDYREYIVEYDPEEALFLRSQVALFLDEVANDVRPDVDAHTQTYQTIRELHPEIDGTDIDLDTDIAHRYVTARHELKAAQEREQFARSAVADSMGNAKRARWDDYTIATRQAKGGGTPFVVAGRQLPEPTEFEPFINQGASL